MILIMNNKMNELKLIYLHQFCFNDSETISCYHYSGFLRGYSLYNQYLRIQNNTQSYAIGTQATFYVMVTESLINQSIFYQVWHGHLLIKMNSWKLNLLPHKSWLIHIDCWTQLIDCSCRYLMVALYSILIALNYKTIKEHSLYQLLMQWFHQQD